MRQAFFIFILLFSSRFACFITGKTAVKNKEKIDKEKFAFQEH